MAIFVIKIRVREMDGVKKNKRVAALTTIISYKHIEMTKKLSGS